jgi:acyl-CoA hydrolase
MEPALPGAGEPSLLLAVVCAPARVNAWVNLGQTYGKGGRRSMAVACLAMGDRSCRKRDATRQFFQKVAEDEDNEVREVARQTLQLQLVQAGTD